MKKHGKATAREALTSYLQQRLLFSAYLPGQPSSIASYYSPPANAPCPALLSKTYFVESFQCWGTKTAKGGSLVQQKAAALLLLTTVKLPSSEARGRPL